MWSALALDATCLLSSGTTSCCIILVTRKSSGLDDVEVQIHTMHYQAVQCMDACTRCTPDGALLGFASELTTHAAAWADRGLFFSSYGHCDTMDV